MKKGILILSAIAMVVTTGCENKKQKEQLENAEALAAATHEELVLAVTERDQLLSIINEITTTTEEIKNMENIVSINNASGENAYSDPQVVANINAIKATLEQRRQKLDELEKSLKNSKTANSKLLATVENLKNQIDTQAHEIESLTTRLADANAQIADLDSQVAQVTSERDSVQAVAKEQEELANSCYYYIGSKSELKDNGLLEGGGFLRKDKVNTTKFNKAIFTRADKRTLTTIPLHSDKAKVITSFQPKDSYSIVDDNGQKVLVINSPSAFWSVSDFLIIQID